MAVSEGLIYVLLVLGLIPDSALGEICWFDSDFTDKKFDLVRCDHGCCNYNKCCVSQQQRDNSHLVVLVIASTCGGIAFIVILTSIFACCFCCKCCCCYRYGQGGRTVAPSPDSPLSSDNVCQSNTWSPLHSQRMFNASSCYTERPPWMVPGLPPFGDSGPRRGRTLGYCSPEYPPAYSECNPSSPPPSYEYTLKDSDSQQFQDQSNGHFT